MNGWFSRCTAAPILTLTRPFERCERTQQQNRIHTMGSKPNCGNAATSDFYVLSNQPLILTFAPDAKSLKILSFSGQLRNRVPFPPRTAGVPNFPTDVPFEPTPGLLILCCMHSKHESCCKSVNSYAAAPREKRSFMQTAARTERPRTKSRAKHRFAASASTTAHRLNLI
jgi:hypothetical protein